MFVAPALLWIGSTLLLVRIRGRLFELLAPKRATTTRAFLLVSAARRASSINRGLVIIALLLAFAVNLSVFSSTWDQQSLVDARLTVGSDIVVSGAPNVQPVVAKTPGITGTTALDHTYAYVGPDLQDVFAIDPSTFLKGTSLRDSYFLRRTARDMMNRLKATPAATLASKQPITD